MGLDKQAEKCYNTDKDDSVRCASVERRDPGQVGTAELAYLGDAAIELWVRMRLIGQGYAGAGRLNKLATDYVRASAQAQAVRRILPLLSEEEEALFRRGRNSHCGSVPKHAEVMEYRYATGFETLCGWLWLNGREARMYELLEEAYRAESENES